MALPPGYASSGAYPVAPTGYEGLQEQIARRRKMGDALLQAGIAGPGANAQSWAQVLGSLAQAWMGKSMTKDADKKEAGLNQQRMQDYAAENQLFDQDIKAGIPVDQMISKYGGHPLLAERMKPLVEAYTNNLKNKGTVEGAPIDLKGPDGFGTYNRTKSGDLIPLPGNLSLPPKLENVGGIATDMSHQAPGAVLPQTPTDTVIRDAKGNMTLNPLAITAKSQIARAGAPTTSVQLTNTMAKDLPPIIASDLQKSRETAELARDALPNLAAAEAALSKGAITGFGANARLDMARFGDMLGVAGKDTHEKIANTQVMLQALGKQMFPILAALRPASDTDLLIAQKMSGGDATLSPEAILHAIRAAQQESANTLNRHKQKVERIGGLYGKRNPSLGEDIATFAVDDAPVAPAAPSAPAAPDANLQNMTREQKIEYIRNLRKRPQ